MAKTYRKKQTWYFWYSLTEYSPEILIGEIECIMPGRTALAKELAFKFNNDLCRRYGWSIDKSNLS